MFVGGSGIGFGLVEQFLKRGCPKVLISGRRDAVLKEAAAQHPGKIFYVLSDAGVAKDREQLLAWVQKNHPDCNALVNNAGIQRRCAPVQDRGAWTERAAEIDINLCEIITLISSFLPHSPKTRSSV